MKHDFVKVAIDIVQMQYDSHATQAEFDAIRNDFQTLGLSPITPAPSARALLGESSALYDIQYRAAYAVVEAQFTPKGWADKQAAIVADLKQLGRDAPQSAVDQLMSDLKAVAQSAGVTPEEHNQYWDDEAAVIADLSALPNPPYSLDPFNFYYHHLDGFIARH